MVLKAALSSLITGVLFSACTSTPPVNADGSPDAERLYNIHCAACHKQDGTGGISGAKNLVITKLNAEKIEEVITKGQGDMMPFESILKPEEIEAVAAFAHDFKY
jgi:mono/diheme cytochrome c family protein